MECWRDVCASVPGSPIAVAVDDQCRPAAATIAEPTPVALAFVCAADPKKSWADTQDEDDDTPPGFGDKKAAPPAADGAAAASTEAAADKLASELAATKVRPRGCRHVWWPVCRWCRGGGLMGAAGARTPSPHRRARRRTPQRSDAATVLTRHAHVAWPPTMCMPCMGEPLRLHTSGQGP
jgi:hypothetical protein